MLDIKGITLAEVEKRYPSKFQTIGYDTPLELNDLHKPKVLSSFEMCINIILTLLMMKPGQYPSIPELGIDISHFTGSVWNKGKKGGYLPRIPDSVVFTQNSPYKCSNNLRNRLFVGGYKERKCEICGNTEWNGKPIPLQVHHVNGINTDNRLENLQILCPNCHAQTETYAGKNSKK